MGTASRFVLAAAMAVGLATCSSAQDVAPNSPLGGELPASPAAALAEDAHQKPVFSRAVEHAVTVATGGCPTGMVEIAGNYCPDVEQHCLEWLDPPGKYRAFRCAKYASPAVCRAPRHPMRYCIDRDEQPLTGAAKAGVVPANHVSYVAAKNACTARGARLCSQSEWQFACEGEEMRPYPYGFERDATACNIDHQDLGRPGGGLKDLRTKVGANPRCSSPFGVRDLAGNLEEWVSRDPGTGGKATLLKGSWWLPGRSTCRATNAGHDEVYEGTETGYRCCR